MLTLILSSVLAHAAHAAHAAPAQPLFVPLRDLTPGALVAEHAPQGDTGPAPLAWSTVGDYTVGGPYTLRDEAGAVVLECTLRSFELRDEELWATLACPVGQTASL